LIDELALKALKIGWFRVHDSHLGSFGPWLKSSALSDKLSVHEKAGRKDIQVFPAGLF
jgi:hypothetical protein